MIYEKVAVCKPGRGSSRNHPGALISGFAASRTVRNKLLLFKPPGLQDFVMVTELTETGCQSQADRQQCPEDLLSARQGTQHPHSTHGESGALSHTRLTAVEQGVWMRSQGLRASH